ncbi:MAG TPA: hypothetical protein VMJ10_00455 [Kofleriaceae bacterium]|nr:hypothetical protein [Kofleriaceae bacterium]
MHLISDRIVFITGLCAAAGCGTDDMKAAPQMGTGPGASLRCDSSGKNAWETYGADAFVAVNKSIFNAVGTELGANGDSNVGGSFALIGTGNPPATRDPAPTFEGKLAAFLVYAYGGPTEITYTDGLTYQGEQDMTIAHTGLGITSSQYDYFIGNIVVPALTGNGVAHGMGGSADPDDVASCFAPIVTDPTFKASIVGK